MADDNDALIELGKHANVDSLHKVIHYLYFPTERAGKEAVRRLVEWGYLTEDRLSADDVNWLVLASVIEKPSTENISGMRDRLEALATGLGGEYDGWECEVAGK